MQELEISFLDHCLLQKLLRDQKATVKLPNVPLDMLSLEYYEHGLYAP